MKVYYSDHFVLPLPPGHRFPTEKYARLRNRLSASGTLAPGDLQVSPAACDSQLCQVHTPDYMERVSSGRLLPGEIRRLGFPWSPGLVERSRRSVGGTIAAACSALEDGLAANLAGGTHHAFPDRGEGYCVFNDVAVASRHVQRARRVSRIVVLDLDVHQGNGTAAIFGGDPSVFTLSVHGANNYPFQKVPGDLDLELQDGARDEAYLEAVETGVRTALARAKADLALYLAGADPYVHDRLGRLAISTQGLAARDRLVFDLCADAGVPVAVVMAGGYARDVEDIVQIHFNTLAEAVLRTRSGGSRLKPRQPGRA